MDSRKKKTQPRAQYKTVCLALSSVLACTGDTRFMYSSRMMRGALLCMAWCLFCFNLPDFVMNFLSVRGPTL